MASKPKAPALEPDEEQDRGGTRRRGPKHRIAEPAPEPPPTAVERLTARERLGLAGMVKRHGPDVVAEAARTIGPSRDRGRPPSGDEPILELISFADYFFERMEEHREAGSRHPRLATMKDVFRLEGRLGASDPDAFRRFVETTRRKLAVGRRLLKHAKDTAELRAWLPEFIALVPAEQPDLLPRLIAELLRRLPEKTPAELMAEAPQLIDQLSKKTGE